MTGGPTRSSGTQSPNEGRTGGSPEEQAPRQSTWATAERPARRWWPAPLVAVSTFTTVAAYLLRGEAQTAPSTDFAVHLAYTRWAARRMTDGHLPFDGWFAFLSGGLPAFHEYQTLPHLLAAALTAGAGTTHPVELFRWVLLSTLPLAFYAGCRLLRIERWRAAAVAAMSLFPVSERGFGIELSSFLHRGLGTWSMLWTVWLSPIAVGLAWRGSSLDDGTFAGTVQFDRPAAVLLRSAFHPRMSATVDGRPTPVEMVAPGMMAVRVPSGRHEVRFAYRPIRWTWLLLLGGVTLACVESLAIRKLRR